ncbi:UDP-glycosyltransferase 83A1-like [Pistacia vera]|uniref:UDP-glycosyltransferase 83A1-like n=1 Tax=Pistacia vera TaxID=55513 RepID=UPI0012639DAF|nr:UDP-glycosyltransferase 83A1-like [Pistacia vera]
MGNPHVLVIPCPAQGHVIPLMELSQCLVKHGIRITFVNTDNKIVNVPSTKNGENNQIHLVSVFVGLDSPEPEKLVEGVLKFMPRKVEELIENIDLSDSDKITCVLTDDLHSWPMEIAVQKGIKGAVFYPSAATQLVFGSNVQKLIDDGVINNDGTTKKQVFQLSPTMPTMSTDHLWWTSYKNTKLTKMVFDNMVRCNRSRKLADKILCNSTYDLEAAAFDMNPNIIPIGPLLASSRCEDTGGSFWQEDFNCFKWLDQQQPQSVIYIAFGSSTILDRKQFHELALGLELSNRPFLWVVRPNIIDDMSDAYPEGFLDRVASRGHIVSWAPQQKVLAHTSISCFLSHCGWNSTMEGVSNGLPFLCWPYFADQFLNRTYICDIWKVGLAFTKDEKEVIRREEIRSKVDQLLDNAEYRTRVLHLKEIVMNNIKEGGCSYKNFMNFIEWIKE